MRAARGLRKDVVETCQLLFQRGWVANHDGNITVRLDGDRYLATPTATSKGNITEGSLIEVDRSGKRLAGTGRPFGELGLHLAVYSRRDDVGAVVHAHPPHATAIACSRGNPIERPFIAEAVVSIGAAIPKIGFAMPGAEATGALSAAVDDVDAVLLANHGAIAWGADVEQAYLRLELLEHLARIAVLAQPLGGVQPLPDSAIKSLLERRARAGLGKAADNAVRTPGQHSTTPDRATTHESASPASPDASSATLARVIREEIMRVLDQSVTK
ncbi:MAG: class II aldolase/adducin family protein [Proteobacteria bacterium]|nr:class II aldolase/adducin family protein [Pseudomonadota bacterium]